MACQSVTLVSPAKTAELIEMSFGMWTRLRPRKHVLDGVYIGATWRIRLNRPCAAAMRPFCEVSWSLTSLFSTNMAISETRPFC